MVVERIAAPQTVALGRRTGWGQARRGRDGGPATIAPMLPLLMRLAAEAVVWQTGAFVCPLDRAMLRTAVWEGAVNLLLETAPSNMHDSQLNLG